MIWIKNLRIFENESTKKVTNLLVYNAIIYI